MGNPKSSPVPDPTQHEKLVIWGMQQGNPRTILGPPVEISKDFNLLWKEIFNFPEPPGTMETAVAEAVSAAKVTADVLTCTNQTSKSLNILNIFDVNLDPPTHSYQITTTVVD